MRFDAAASWSVEDWGGLMSKLQDWKTEFLTSPYSWLLTKILLLRILIMFRLYPFCNNAHLSFNKTASLALSLGDKSGFINTGDDKDPLLARTWLTWIILRNLTRIDLGLDGCGLYFPRRWQSIMVPGSGMTPNPLKMEDTDSKSSWNWNPLSEILDPPLY